MPPEPDTQTLWEQCVHGVAEPLASPEIHTYCVCVPPPQSVPILPMTQPPPWKYTKPLLRPVRREAAAVEEVEVLEVEEGRIWLECGGGR